MFTHGYRKIVFVRGPEWTLDANIRFEAYKEFLIEQDINYDPDMVFNGNFRWDVAREIAKDIFNKDHADIEAIVNANDDMALGFYYYFKEKGIRVPEDIALYLQIHFPIFFSFPV